MDDLTFVAEGETRTVDFDDVDGVLAVFEELTGTMPEGYEPEDPDGYVFDDTRYDWAGVTVTVWGAGTESESIASIRVVAPTVGGVPVRTPEGITVGSSREDALAAGADDPFDDPEYLQIGRQEVPDTESLVNPGEVGILFIVLQMEADAVAAISTPGNDFSDL
ncbi:hypothetical protein Microterr_07980 [Microbacterium terricola]|uniref:Uncharacterized protein n=2 Tax=Microbacterium terricola TaxID=344163 RepID=A0ABM8DWT8_9MICO|nr:hypothetical protein Microterr_07980 [Microbacterium terricola]